jgi:cyclophilin family peptidyl-prolyl cis-trans isomerase
MKFTRLPFIAAALAATTLSASAQSRVTINVDAGGGNSHPVVIELDEKNAPLTSTNFKKLTNDGFYDGIAFHRVVPNYIVQVGDPLTRDASKKIDWGTGGPGYTVPAETGQKHLRGSVAMARLSDGVNPSRASSGSQFYICLADIPTLDGDYTVFGKVVSGLEHIDRISRAAADTNNNPVSRIAIANTKVEGLAAANVAATTATPKEANEATKAADTASAMLAPKTGEGTPAETPKMAIADSAVGSLKEAATGALASGDSPKEMAASALAAAESAIAASGEGGGEFAALVAAAKEKAGIATSSAPAPGPAPGSTGTAINMPTGSTPVQAAASATPSGLPASALPAASSDNGGGDVNAALTQPVPDGERSQVVTSAEPTVKAETKPKKKEGFFTRMIKKVW